MKSVLKHIRLLPAVIVVAAALLALKGEVLVREAWAQESSAPSGDTAVLAQEPLRRPKTSPKMTANPPAPRKWTC